MPVCSSGAELQGTPEEPLTRMRISPLHQFSHSAADDASEHSGYLKELCIVPRVSIHLNAIPWQAACCLPAFLQKHLPVLGLAPKRRHRSCKKEEQYLQKL